MPEHTSDEAEKAKEVSQMSTQKPQELWNRELPHNGRRAKNKNILWISLNPGQEAAHLDLQTEVRVSSGSKDFMFGTVVTWDFQVGCTEDMSS